MTIPTLTFSGNDAAEPLKVARLVLGIDDRPGEPLRLVPRLPAGWNGMEAREWPVLLPEGLARANITMSNGSEGMHFSLVPADGRRVPQVHLRLGGSGRFVRQSFSDVNRLDLHCPRTETQA